MQGGTLPSLLPEDAHVTEYVGLRQCNSVTIGWYPVPQQESIHYCIRATELPFHPSMGQVIPKIPNQCGLDARIRGSTDFYVVQCIERSVSDFRLVYTRSSYFSELQ